MYVSPNQSSGIYMLVLSELSIREYVMIKRFVSDLVTYKVEHEKGLQTTPPPLMLHACGFLVLNLPLPSYMCMTFSVSPPFHFNIYENGLFSIYDIRKLHSLHV